MLLAVDGTGLADDAEYEREMKNSFIRQLVAEYTGGRSNTIYRRGPSLLGLESGEIAAEAFVLVRNRALRGEPIVLAGYSRGGAICIRIAQLLKEALPEVRIPVMALFDAVDRQLHFDAARVPNNVEQTYHAMRDSGSGSRDFFGNCGTSAEAPGKMERQRFLTTHGGMGGVPFPEDSVWANAVAAVGVAVSELAPPNSWTGALAAMGVTVSEAASVGIDANTELQQSDEVRTWMWQQLRKHGIVR